MLKTNSMLLLGGAGVAAYFLVRKAHGTAVAAKALEYTNPKITFGKFKFTSIELAMTIDFVNPSSTPIAMEFFTGNVGYAGKILSSFTFDGNGKNIVIGARKTTTVPLTLVIKTPAALISIVKLLKKVASGEKVDTVIAVDGRFYYAGVDLPVNFLWDLKTQNWAPAPKVAGIGRINWKRHNPARHLFGLARKIHPFALAKTLRNRHKKKSISGIGSASATLKFTSNDAMINYFNQAPKQLIYSKN